LLRCGVLWPVVAAAVAALPGATAAKLPQPDWRGKRHLRVGVLRYGSGQSSAPYVRALRPIRQVAKKYGDQLDLLVTGPEWGFRREDRLFTRDGFHRIRRVLESATADNDMLIISGTIPHHGAKSAYRNTSLLCHRGRTIGSVSKKYDGADRLMGDRNRTNGKRDPKRWRPGRGPNIIEFGGCRIGVEICFDHSFGVLSRETRKTGKPVDLHVFLSRGAGLENPRPTRKGLIFEPYVGQETQPDALAPGGYTIHNDGSLQVGSGRRIEGVTQVLRRSAADQTWSAMSKISPTREIRVPAVKRNGRRWPDGVTLQIYDLELP
jgi:hypothetical protein